MSCVTANFLEPFADWWFQPSRRFRPEGRFKVIYRVVGHSDLLVTPPVSFGCEVIFFGGSIYVYVCTVYITYPP